MLGVKVHKSVHNLGEKISKASHSLGNRYYPNATKSNKSVIGANSQEGLENTGNSTDQHQEPKKFNAVTKPRDYTTNIQHSRIEKQRKEKPKDKHNPFL